MEVEIDEISASLLPSTLVRPDESVVELEISTTPEVADLGAGVGAFPDVENDVLDGVVDDEVSAVVEIFEENVEKAGEETPG